MIALAWIYGAGAAVTFLAALYLIGAAGLAGVFEIPWWLVLLFAVGFAVAWPWVAWTVLA